ncbi:MAG: trypsin-like peptidase domain-containing protein [Planctomycetes bacterium]|nr:trypsin-like peptidase domain-containing protein [Planctomycetota bacterium]
MRPRAMILALAFALAAGGEVRAADRLVRDLERRIVGVAERASRAFAFLDNGSGVVVSADGEVLTNNHVVMGIGRIEVRLAGGRRFVGEVVGREPIGDFALLKLRDAKGLEFLPIGDSDALQVGEFVIAIGNPFRLGNRNGYFPTPASFEPTVTLGSVTGLYRFRGGYSAAIQTDAAINPGNSGGPLVDLDGRLVGINGMIETRFQNRVHSGVGFAVPAAQILRYLSRLREAKGGVVPRGDIPGLSLVREPSGGAGAEVGTVSPGSFAAKAGFRAGDAIVGIGAYAIPSWVRFLGLVGTFPAGDEVSVRVRRADGEVEIPVRLATAGQAEERDPDAAYLGVWMEDAEGGGVEIRVVLPGTPAQDAGIEVGDVVLAIDGEAAADTDALKEKIKTHKPGEKVKLKVRRASEGAEPKELEIEVTLGKFAG